jgi:hypothetical protein
VTLEIEAELADQLRGRVLNVGEEEVATRDLLRCRQPVAR